MNTDHQPGAEQLRSALITIAPTVYWHWLPGHRQEEQLATELRQLLADQEAGEQQMLALAERIYQLTSSQRWEWGGNEQRQAQEMLGAQLVKSAGINSSN